MLVGPGCAHRSSVPVNIGVDLPLAGADAEGGLDALHAINAVVGDYARRGGPPVELLIEDTAAGGFQNPHQDEGTDDSGNAGHAAITARQLAADPSVLAVIGGFTTPVATAEVRSVDGRAALLVGNADDAFPNARARGVFLYSPAGARTAALANQLRSCRVRAYVLTFDPRNPARQVADHLRRAGAQIAGAYQMRSLADDAAALNAVRSASPDVVLTFGTQTLATSGAQLRRPEAFAILRQLTQSGWWPGPGDSRTLKYARLRRALPREWNGDSVGAQYRTATTDLLECLRVTNPPTRGGVITCLRKHRSHISASYAFQPGLNCKNRRPGSERAHHASLRFDQTTTAQSKGRTRRAGHAAPYHRQAARQLAGRQHGRVSNPRLQ